GVTRMLIARSAQLIASLHDRGRHVPHLHVGSRATDRDLRPACSVSERPQVEARGDSVHVTIRDDRCATPPCMADKCGMCSNAVCHTEVCTNRAPSCAPGRTACGTTFGGL